MIVTNANELASKIHDRMPVLVQPGDFALVGWQCRKRIAQTSG
jgi:putative SOS response-associated peptidase YedK